MALLLALPSVVVTASTVDSQFDLSLEQVSVSNPIVVGEQNFINATVYNNGDVPVNATVLFIACEDKEEGEESECVNMEEPKMLDVPPDRSPVPVTVEWSNWNAEENETQLDPTTDVNIRLEVLHTSEWQQRQAEEIDVDDDGEAGAGISRQDEVDNARDGWEDTWEGPIEEPAKKDLDELLFDDPPAGGNPLEDERDRWDGAWDTLEGHYRSIGKTLFPEQDPTRLDRDQEHNVHVKSREVVEHEIRSVVTDPSETSLNVSAGETVQGTVQYTNHGTADNTLRLSFEGVKEGWTFTVDPEVLTVPTGPTGVTKGVVVSITGPQDAFETEEGKAFLVATSDQAPLTGSKNDTITSPPAEVTGDIALSVDRTTVTVDPRSQDNVTYTATVKNQRSGAINVFPVENVGVPDAWQDDVTITPTFVQLGRGGSADFTVEIPVGEDCAANLEERDCAVAGDHLFNATFGWGSQGSNDEGQKQASTFTLTVPQWHAVGFESTTTPSEVDPGEDHPLAFGVRNDGNGPDTFRITLINAPTDWTLVDAAGDTPDTFEVGSGGTETVTTHHLRVPSTAEQGIEFIGFRVESDFGDAFAVLDDHQVEVNSRGIPALTLQDPAASCGSADGSPFCVVKADPPLEIPMILHNQGNDEATMYVAATLEDAGGNVLEDPDWTVSLQHEQITIDSDRSVQSKLTLTAPSDLDSSFEGTLKVTLSNDPDDSDAGDAQQRQVFAAVPELGVAVAGTDPDPAYQVIDGHLLLTVTNHGKEAAGPFDVEVDYSLGGDSHTETVPVEDGLAAGADTEVAVPIPTKAGKSSMTADITVDPDGEVGEYLTGHPLSHSNVVPQHAITLRLFDITIEKPRDRSVDPGQKVTLNGTNSDNEPLGFVVKNKGQEESFHVTLEAPWPDAEWSWPGETLADGGETSYGKDFFVPDEPDDLTVELTLHVRHADHPALHVQNSFNIEVNDTWAPHITTIPPTLDEVHIGSSLRIAAEIDDLSGVESAKVVMTLPGGGTKHIAMQHDADAGEYHVTVPFNVTGVHMWYIQARDTSTAGNVGDTSDAPHSIDVLPGSKPQLTLIFPTADDVIQPGEKVVVSVSNTTGIQSAHAVVPGIGSNNTTLPALNPLRIPTDLWPDGVANVTVHVVDVFGSVVEEHYNISIDGTPPSIGEPVFVGVTPGEPTNVTVAVTDDFSVASVKIRVDSGGGAGATDVPMVRMGSGDDYAATVTYPSDSGSLTVLVEDVAGNAASNVIVSQLSSDSADVDGDGSDSRPVPTAGMAVILPAILAAALILGRRVRDDEGEGR